jgi:hypothetical protein
LIIFYLLSVLAIFLLLNTPIFAHIYGMELAAIIHVPMPRFDSKKISAVITVFLIIIMYFILFKINTRFYNLMKKFFLPKAFLLPVCMFFVLMVLVSNKMILNHNAEQSVILYMISIFVGILINYVAILIILDSILIQYILVKTAFFDMVKSKWKFAYEDIDVIISTYLNFTLTFATIYFHMQSFSDWTAFYGIERVDNLFETVVNCVYFSFMTISSTGFGDIYPVEWYAKVLVCIEILSGVFLVTFSFGIILNSISQSATISKHNRKLPKVTVTAITKAKCSRTNQRTNGKTAGTLNYVTFELDTGERMVICVSDHEYDLILEEDLGKLTFQGSQFISFERDMLCAETLRK